MSIVRTTSQRGQGMVEYIIILAMIAIAAIGIYSLFGKTVRNQAAGLTQELAGKAGAQQIQAAQTASNKASSNANQAKDMGSYDKANIGQ
jgi:Tfp pilus assembly protein PilV